MYDDPQIYKKTEEGGDLSVRTGNTTCMHEKIRTSLLKQLEPESNGRF